MAKPKGATQQEALAFIRARRIDYKLCFGSPAGARILVDLASFCRANESTYHDDPRKAANLDGRREVWLRIQQHLNLTDEQIFGLFSGHEPQLKEDDNAD